MTFQTITGGYPSGYTLDMPTYSGLSITNTGSVGTNGVQLNLTGTVINYGTVAAAPVFNQVGVYLANGGSLANGGGGTIYGIDGVKSPFTSGSTTTVTNVGSIGGQDDGVDLFSGGQVTNGANPVNLVPGTISGGVNGVYVSNGAVTNYSQINAGSGSGVEIVTGVVQNGALDDASAIIASRGAGVTATGAASVTNFATILFNGITGYGAAGVALADGGSFTNGAVGDTTALVKANVGVTSSAGYVFNYATIAGAGGPGTSGVELQAGAGLTNGPGPQPAVALVEGYTGVTTSAGYSNINNLGTILGLGGAGQAGVYVADGGRIANGDLSGSGNIYGYVGIEGAGGAPQVTVANLGSIGGRQDGVDLLSGGTITNGADFVKGPRTNIFAGTISGGTYGVYINNGSVANFSLISAGAGSGVEIGYGQVNNGAANDTSALITSRGDGITSFDGTNVANYATIMSDGPLGYGVALESGGSLTNGSPTSSEAVIKADTGITATNAAVANYATIEGIGGQATSGVLLQGGSSLVNGSITDRAAVIEGYAGVTTSGRYANIYNAGTIEGLGKPGQPGVNLAPPGQAGGAGVYLDGGYLANGAGVDTTALIEGYSGVTVAGGGTVRNAGVIDGVGLRRGYGIVFTAGGYLTNGSAFTQGSVIEGYSGVVFEGAAGMLRNAGTILALGAQGQYGVTLADGGMIQNGANYARGALIKGDSGVALQAAGTLANYGAVVGIYHGVRANGGAILNGSPTDPTALIEGYIGIEGAATVTNFGTVESGAGHFYFPAGAVTDPGGVVTNGGGGDTTALLTGAFGVYLQGAGTVTNFATITGAGDAGVQAQGGAIANGSGSDTIALIDGVIGVDLAALGTVANFATIDGGSGYGVLLEQGGDIVNGGGTDRAALIEGANGIAILAAVGTVANFGTILQTGVGNAVTLADGGSVTNGSLSNSVALIEGEGGVRLAGPGTVVNYATILGAGDVAGSGVVLYDGDTLTNGAAGHAGALIEGNYGVYGGNGAQITVTNYGTIVGQAGDAVRFASSSDELIVEAGSEFVGQVMGDGGEIDLASGTGAMILNGDTVTVSASMPTAVFDNFDQVEIASGASFALTGAGASTAGESLLDYGALSVGDALTVGGSLFDGGTLAGSGQVDLAGGSMAFAAGAVLAVARVSQSGAGSLAIDKSGVLDFAGVWTQSAGTVLAGNRINFSGAGDSFAGSISGPGTVAFVGGSDTLDGAALSVKSVIINGASVTLQGSISLSSVLTATTTDLVIAAGGASLLGGGTLSLTGSAANTIIGADAAAILANESDKIIGSGSLGDGRMRLVNDVAGVIDADRAVTLIIDTGANTIVNAGAMEATAAGGMVIESAIDNTGALKAEGGNLTVEAAVTGAGSVVIDGATADFASSFDENVDFTGAGGVLELARSQTYAGRVIGFSKTGATSLDLEDIDFGAKTKATYSGSATSGVLTVTDGTHTARITLVGDYLSSAFIVGSDGHGGTKVIDPAGAPSPPPAPGATPHQFIAAMATFGAAGGGAMAAGHAAVAIHSPMLARPGSATA